MLVIGSPARRSRLITRPVEAVPGPDISAVPLSALSARVVRPSPVSSMAKGSVVVCWVPSATSDSTVRDAFSSNVPASRQSPSFAAPHGKERASV